MSRKIRIEVLIAALSIYFQINPGSTEGTATRSTYPLNSNSFYPEFAGTTEEPTVESRDNTSEYIERLEESWARQETEMNLKTLNSIIPLYTSLQEQMSKNLEAEDVDAKTFVRNNQDLEMKFQNIEHRAMASRSLLKQFADNNKKAMKNLYKINSVAEEIMNKQANIFSAPFSMTEDYCVTRIKEIIHKFWRKCPKERVESVQEISKAMAELKSEEELKAGFEYFLEKFHTSQDQATSWFFAAIKHMYKSSKLAYLRNRNLFDYIFDNQTSKTILNEGCGKYLNIDPQSSQVLADPKPIRQWYFYSIDNDQYFDIRMFRITEEIQLGDGNLDAKDQPSWILSPVSDKGQISYQILNKESSGYLVVNDCESGEVSTTKQDGRKRMDNILWKIGNPVQPNIKK